MHAYLHTCMHALYAHTPRLITGGNAMSPGIAERLERMEVRHPKRGMTMTTERQNAQML